MSKFKSEKLKMENKIFFINSKKGVALIWTLLVSSVLVVMATTMSILVIKELRVSSNIDDSTRAYLAAEAGMERALYDMKNFIRADIDWCGNFNYNNQAILGASSNPEISYSVSLKSICSPNREVEIESTGISRGTNFRKIKSKITIISNSTDIDRFDNSNNLFFPKYNPMARNISNVTLSKPLIIQQFDLKNLSTGNVGGGFDVGMATSSGATDFGVRFTRVGAQVNVNLTGKINNINISPTNSFSFSPSSSDTYRVKLEYSKNGAGSLGYTVVRAIILRRDISGGQDKYQCISNGRFTVYSGITAFENNTLNRVVINNGSYFSNSDSQHIRVGTGVILDDMAFWGRE